MTRTIDIIAGARPNFMKISPIIRAMEAGIRAGSGLRYRLVHTGQHYDARMSGDFFDQLGIPHPHENLEVGSGSQAEQAGAIMVLRHVPRGRGRDQHDGMCDLRPQVVHPGSSCRGRDSQRRLVDA
jgi:hypothetical protein